MISKLLKILYSHFSGGNMLLGWDGLRLLFTAIQAVNLKAYQRGSYSGEKDANGVLLTYCNNFARDFLDSKAAKFWDKGYLIGGPDAILKNGYNFDISCLGVNKSIYDIVINTPIEEAYENAISACKKGVLIEHNAESAQVRATLGVPVWVTSVKRYHEAIVVPDVFPFSKGRGCLIAQAGLTNGIMYLADEKSFGAYGSIDDPEIKFYEFPMC